MTSRNSIVTLEAPQECQCEVGSNAVKKGVQWPSPVDEDRSKDESRNETDWQWMTKRNFPLFIGVNGIPRKGGEKG